MVNTSVWVNGDVCKRRMDSSRLTLHTPHSSYLTFHLSIPPNYPSHDLPVIMSGQSLSDVVGSAIHSMIQSTSLFERLHRYVVALDNHIVASKVWANDDDSYDDMETWTEEFEGECPITYLFVPEYLEHIEQYLTTRTGAVPVLFEHDDWTVMSGEIEAFKQFLTEHQYMEPEELVRIGLKVDTVHSTLDKNDGYGVGLISCVQLWNESRMLAGRADVSFGVFYGMRKVCLKLVTECMESRVTLTPAERRLALEEALRIKHRQLCVKTRR